MIRAVPSCATRAVPVLSTSGHLEDVYLHRLRQAGEDAALDTFLAMGAVEPNTWTLLATTPKAQSWSFWSSVTGETTNHEAFLGRSGRRS